MSEREDTAYTDTELLRMAVAGYARGSESLLPAFDAMVAHVEALEGALRRHVDDHHVSMPSDLRAALAGEPDANQVNAWDRGFRAGWEAHEANAGEPETGLPAGRWFDDSAADQPQETPCPMERCTRVMAEGGYHYYSLQREPTIGFVDCPWEGHKEGGEHGEGTAT